LNGLKFLRLSQQPALGHPRWHQSRRSSNTPPLHVQRRGIPSPGVNFINSLRRSFSAHRSQKHKNDSQVIDYFALLGSTRIKAALKHVGEINPRIESIVYFAQQKSYRSRVSQRDPEASSSMNSFSHLYSVCHHRHNNNHPRCIIEAVWVSWAALRGRLMCYSIICNNNSNNILTTAERDTRENKFPGCHLPR